jgi:hypothetical protein
MRSETGFVPVSLRIVIIGRSEHDIVAKARPAGCAARKIKNK